MKQNKRKRDILFVSLAIAFSLSAFLLLHEFFNRELNNFTIEIMAAALGSVIVVASMAVMLRLQAQQDKEREYAITLFERKLQIYEKLLTTIFKTDDDNRISREEIQEVENQIGLACLMANEELVSSFTQFIYQFKVYGVLYFRSMSTSQIDHFIAAVQKAKESEHTETFIASSKHIIDDLPQENPQAYFLSLDEIIQGIRDDLDVVEGNIQHNIENFVSVAYDQFKMMRNPNIVDEHNES